MTEQILTYAFTFLGLVGFWLAGKKVWWCWYINIFNQLLWTAFALLTGYYALIIGSVFYFVVFTKNAIQWTRDHFKDEEKTQRLLPKVTFTVDDDQIKRGLKKAEARLEKLDVAFNKSKGLISSDNVETDLTEQVYLGQDGHICHASPIPNHAHSFRCPSGEHPTGWRHNQGPHKTCNVCR